MAFGLKKIIKPEQLTGLGELLTNNDRLRAARILNGIESLPNDNYSHYFKDVSKLNEIDIYRVLELYQVTDPCLQHAVKKLLCAGNRGDKDFRKDIEEARDALNRKLEMMVEDGQ